MRTDRLPLTYTECRARFGRACREAGVVSAAHDIGTVGPDGERLTIDTAWLGSDRPTRALVVLSGVHGVEAFLPSTLQTELVQDVASRTIPDDVALLIVHVVNPWGMAWWRRQNESNVDLNRNWRRSEVAPVHNDAYDEIHPVVCPDTPELPSVDELLESAAAWVADRGLPWVRDAITAGQYRHDDGLHFGGGRTESSCRVLQAVVNERLAGVDELLTLDLHTGAGAWSDVMFLCNRPADSERHRLLTGLFGADRVEVTAADTANSTGPKSGGIATGFGDLLPSTNAHSTVVEWGTEPDLEQLKATYLESWVHRHGDRDRPDHAEIVWRYRSCFSPDDRDWEQTCLATGRALLSTAVEATFDGAIG